MNKFHVFLLVVLCVVSGVNAGDGVAVDSVEALQTKEGYVSHAINFEKARARKVLLTLGKDALVYNNAPDVVGKVAKVAQYITPSRVKNNMPAVPAMITNNIIVNNIPNAVNAENANRVLTEGLVALLLQQQVYPYNRGGWAGIELNLPTVKGIKADGKVAVNSMKDAVVAITAVEFLSWVGNIVVTTAGGERAEQFIANHAGLVKNAKAFSYAVFKQISAVTVKAL